ncbi:signal transduction histidine kinase [Nocardiopsis arvandica]|uniref:histidine kinase n=1 Tax=Nocardiopsis sinuspersici TaxID=501010 RepID=A0A7Y9X846_9ACTN|nr:nitrate- and nitrite sensing domain-containing protein [Nocardiopsis sinuspersici]NYH50804.1 signal transduction histidine kinase [Nocardiopsis sinuspersici]
MRRTRDNAPTIRGQLTRIVLIPSLCFLALWLAVAAGGTFQAVQLMGAVAQAREGTQVFSDVSKELRAERRLSVIHLGRLEGGGSDTLVSSALDEQREATDTAMAKAVAFAEKLQGTRDHEVQRSATAFLDTPEVLAESRLRLDENTVGQEETLMRYGGVLDSAAGAITALVHSTDGGENLTDAVLVSELLNARSAYATADALLAGNIARGEMSYEETAHFTYLTASYRGTLDSADSVMHPSVRARYDAMTSQQSWNRAEELSRQVVTRPPIAEPRPTGPAEPEGQDEPDGPGDGESDIRWNTDIDVDADEWDGSSAQAVLAMDELVRAQTGRTVDLAWNAALLQISLAAAAAGLTLVCGIAAISVVGRSSRRLTDRLARLRGQILERDEDLPDIVDRAQRGEKVDVQEELPQLDECGDDEIGQVAEAFDAAQLTAVESAVRQAEIRRGANRAYLGIAFRNQNLVQRQLRLLDEIEQHEQDSEALRRLFRLDHLVTRARRYSDNLIILGGGQSVRRWRQPRPLVDVLRAAIAETEDFERVRLISAPRVLMHGQVVADVVHLLAELVENATQFSPAGTPVDVSCTPAAEGLVVEVEDRGLGMSEHGYEEARRTLKQPPEFDVMALPDDPRLGLFVVSRLADRHGVRVWLQPSPYGGTRATTLIPASLLEPVENTVTVTDALTGGNGPMGGPVGPHGTASQTGPLPLHGSPPGNGAAHPPVGPGHSGPQTPVRTGPQGPFPTGPQEPFRTGSQKPVQTDPQGAFQTDAQRPVHTGPQGPFPSGPQPSFTAPTVRTGPQRTLPRRAVPPNGHTRPEDPAHRPPAPTPPRGNGED